MRTTKIFLLSLLLITSLHSSEDNNNSSLELKPEREESLFVSKEDGQFDVSDYLSTAHGFMPVPIIITEPAIGYGGGLALLFLHDTFGSIAEKKSPPSITAVMGAATQNGTWYGGAAHMGFWKEDSIRSTTAAAYMNVNANFNFDVLSIPITMDMNINGFVAYQELMFRVADSNFFLGGNYLYADNTSKINNQNILPLTQKFKLGGLAGFVQYDSRDSIFTPSKGLYAKAILRRFDENLGGDENFWRYGLKTFYFTPLLNSMTLGVRFEGEAVAAQGDDNVPFYANPAINMRGISATQYQGERMVLGELQLRWEFIRRWNLVLFGGGGKVFGKPITLLKDPIVKQPSVSFSDADFHPAGGVGFRYELARKFGLWGGLDFATSQEEDLAFYITVGSAWGAF